MAWIKLDDQFARGLVVELVVSREQIAIDEDLLKSGPRHHEAIFQRFELDASPCRPNGLLGPFDPGRCLESRLIRRIQEDITITPVVYRQQTKSAD